MDFVSYCGITQDAGKAIAGEMGFGHGDSPPRGRINTLLRWGHSGGVGHVPRLVINKQEAMNRAINKREATRIFKEHGLNVPIPTSIPPCVGRSAYHTQGQNFWLCWERNQIRTAEQEGAEYFIKYIPIKQEWRVHVLGNEVAFVQRKYQTDRVSTAFMGIQGFRNEWHYRILPPEAAGEGVCSLAGDAVSALGLDFGGADIVISIENDLPYILEVNTGPALPNRETRRPYIEYFRRRMR